MSFLNPVNEPVKRFSSTDADAPQINYAARTAGDVKAVLKACLVTGYGAKASAGWSIVNEVDHAAEFVSPSAAMSDYRLGIDDSSTSKTTWYYRYEELRINPSANGPIKSFEKINKSHPSNGWTLLVTERGFYFIEDVWSVNEDDVSARLTYWGQQKSASIQSVGKNIAFFNAGHNASFGLSHNFYYQSDRHHELMGDSSLKFSSGLPYTGKNVEDFSLGMSLIDLISNLYLINDNNAIIGQQVGLLGVAASSKESLFGRSDMIISGRPVLKICLGYHGSTASWSLSRARALMIYTDYWEY